MAPMSAASPSARSSSKTGAHLTEKEKSGNEAEALHSRGASARSLDLFYSPSEVTEDKLKSYKCVVVTDVLRAATSIITALSNGARDILPAASISAATMLASQLARDDVLLCGEREGRMIEGFHLGNSPADYTRDRVRGRTLIFGSTNGAPTIVKASAAGKVLFCAFVNLPAVLEAFFAGGDPFPAAVICAGKLNRFSLEDAVCGGMLIEKILHRPTENLIMNDAARSSQLLVREYGGDLQALLYESDHGKYLISLGMEADLPLCAAYGVLPVTPILKDGKLVRWES